MNDAPIQIRNPEVVRSIRALAEKTGQPITDAVAQAVKAELKRRDAVEEQEFQRRLRAIDELVGRFHALPIVGPLLSDDDLYDDDGLPQVIAVDASAILSILLKEDDGPAFLSILARSRRSVLSAVNYWEVLVRADGLRDEAGLAVAETLIGELNVEVAAVDAQTARAAALAFKRFGRRTPAGLNLGDCFAYALAEREGEGLLFKGGDFAKTDIRNVRDGGDDIAG